MTITLMLDEKLSKQYKVEISKTDFKKHIEQEATTMSSTTNLPGFRPGKAPISMIISAQKGALENKAVDFFVQTTVEKIVTDNKFELAEQPSITDLKLEDEDLSFLISLEILPIIPEIIYKDIKLKKHICTVGQKETEETKNILLKQNREFNPTKEAAQLGDIVLLDAVGFMNGQAFEGGKVQDYKLELGSKSFIDGFESGLIGVTSGEQRKLSLVFPKNYHMKDLADKPVIFDVIAKEILKSSTPKLNQSFADKLNIPMDELEKRITNSTQQHFDNQSQAILRKDLLDYLDTIEVEISKNILNREIASVNAALNDGHTHSKHNGHHHHSAEEITNLAKRRLKLGLFLSNIAKKEKIETSQDDLSEHLKQQMMASPEHAKDIVNYYTKNLEAAQALRGQILENKVISFILGKASILEEKHTPEQISTLYKEAIEQGA